MNSHMNVVQDPSAPRAPYEVDTSRGSRDGSVSKQWMARPHDQRFLDLNALAASVGARAAASRENIVDTAKIEFLAPPTKTREDLHRLYVSTPEDEMLAPTNWSFGQMASLMGAPAGYLRRLPSPIVADAMTYGMRYLRAAEDVKLYSTGTEIRAATSAGYGRIFDRDVVEAVQHIAGNGTGDARWKIPGVLNWSNGTYDPEAPVTVDSTTLYASDRDVFIFLVDDRNPIEIGLLRSGNPDLVFRGFIVSNSEVGSATAQLRAFYLRGVCCNRNLWGVEGMEELSIRHTRSAPDRWIEEARPALVSYADGSTTKFLDGVAKARAAKVAKTEEEAIEFLTDRSFSRKAALKMLADHERDEGTRPETAWDMAQAITAYARDIPFQDARVDVELQAKRILDKVA